MRKAPAVRIGFSALLCRILPSFSLRCLDFILIDSELSESTKKPRII